MEIGLTERILFLISRWPRLVSIFKELYAIIIEGPEGELESYLNELESSFKKVRASKTLEEKREAARSLSDLISRL